jgi:hypothetical protein
VKRHRRSEPVAPRLWARVEKTETCWLWTGCRNKAGYGRIGVEGRRVKLAHRVSYELAKGPIPPGLVLDHLCRVPQCVRPEHLEAVPQSVNNSRGYSFAAVKARQTHCLRGHALSGANVYRYRHSTSRNCRKCHSIVQSARQMAQRRIRRMWIAAVRIAETVPVAA